MHRRELGGDLSQGMLIGRSGELAELEAMLVDARSGQGRSVVLTGEPGIGKTTLLTRQVAAADGMLVLRARGDESESHLAYSCLFDLCRPLVDRFDGIAPHYAGVLQRALALEAPGDHDPLAVAVALLELLATTASDVPVLVSVDDGQWMDSSSAAAVAFVARRVGPIPLCLVVATRGTGVDHDRFTGVPGWSIGRIADPEAMQILRLNAVSPVDPTVGEHLVSEAEGNPLALAEFGMHLSGEELSGHRPLPDHLHVGSSLSQVFERELTLLPPETARQLALVALWEGNLRDLEGAPSLGFDPRKLTPAVEAGMVVVRDGNVEFRNPHARAAALGGFDERTLRQFHLRLSEVTPDDLQRVAHHLAASADGPDDAVAAMLVEAARTAAVSESVDLYERSARFWTDPEDSALSLIRGAESAALRGSAVRAKTLAERAASTANCPSTALRCSHLQGRLALFGVLPVPEGRRLLADALEIAVGADPGRAVRICFDAVLLSVVIGARAEAVAIARRGVALARSEERAGELIDVGEVVLAGALAFEGGPVDEVALEVGCARLISEAVLTPEVVSATEIAMNGLIAQERYRTATAIGIRFVQAARGQGSTGAIPYVLALTGKSELYLDDIESAVVSLKDAELLASESNQVLAATYALLWSGIAAALQGDRSGVEGAAREFARRTAAIGNSSVGNSIISHAFGHLALSEGQIIEAAGHFDDLARFRLALGAVSDGMLRWEGDFVEVLVAVGRTSEAQEQLARLEQRLMVAESPWVRVVAARARALLAPVEEFDAAYRLAVDATGDGFAFARYRTELCWGERLAAEGRPADAVVHLQVAATGFEGIGARTWAARTRGELARVRTATLDESSPPDDHDGPPSSLVDRSSPPRMVVMLGDLVVRGEGQDVRPLGHAGRVIAMVAIRASGVHVGELIEALWPDAPDGVGRTRLRNVLSRSRHLSNSVLRRDGDIIRLVDEIEVDVVEFEREGHNALRQAAAGDDDAPRSARAALSRFGGELVPALRYDDWLVAPRERLRRMHIALLDLLADDAKSRGDVDEMVAYLERGITEDPYDEYRYLWAAQALADERRRGPALRLLDRAAAMVEELGLDVDPRIIDLRFQLETSTSTVDRTGIPSSPSVRRR